VVVGGLVGEKFQDAGACVTTVSISRPPGRIFISMFSLRSVCVSPSCRPGAASGLEVTRPCPAAATCERMLCLFWDSKPISTRSAVTVVSEASEVETSRAAVDA